MRKRKDNNSVSTYTLRETKIYDLDKVSFEHIIMECYHKGYDYIIWVADAEIKNKMIWVTTNKNVLKDFLKLSGQSYYARIQPIAKAIQYNVFDDYW